MRRGFSAGGAAYFPLYHRIFLGAFARGSGAEDELLLSYIVGEKVYEITIDSLDTLYRMATRDEDIILRE